MKHCVLLSMLLALGCVHVYGAPVEVTMEQGSCTDPIALGAADQALTKLNRDRKEGYIFRLERLSDVHMTKHGENSLVFYLTLDVVETNCSVVSRKSWKECAARLEAYGSVYGQCKVAILINRVQRVVHLHKYDCVIRPVPSARLHRRCPDCPSQISSDSETVKRTVSKSLDKFNKESGLTKRFALLKISRASAGMAMSMHYDVEYVIQETTCARSSETHEHCPLMDCEFAHKGFCHGRLYNVPPAAPDAPDAPELVEVTCEIYEPEAAEREKKLHIQGNDTDHSHGDTKAHDHDHDHDHAHSADQTHSHDHVHDHTQSHSHHDKTLKHANDSDHHHTHDHEGGSHRHAHDHSHDHGHDHDHVHAHHAKAHDHSGDSPHQHHDYKHPDGVHTHEHDHEFALDHDHKHAHLHEHEHHHHHHEHAHETTAHDHPMGSVRVLPAVDQPMIMPSFPDKPVGPVAGDSMAVGEEKITFLPFPTSTSAECPPPALEEGGSLVKQLFAEDPLFKPAA